MTLFQEQMELMAICAWKNLIKQEVRSMNRLTKAELDAMKDAYSRLVLNRRKLPGRLYLIRDEYETLPRVIEALEEAWRERDHHRNVLRVVSIQADQIERLERERDEAREALEPLVVNLSSDEELKPDAYPVEIALTVGDVKKARAALGECSDL